MTELPSKATADELAEDVPCEIDVPTGQPVEPNGPVGKALDLLIDGELKLLDICNARQTSADTRTTALASAAIVLPTLILGLSKSFASDAALLKVGYVVIVILVAFIVVGARSWNAWRRRPGASVSAEAADGHPAHDDQRRAGPARRARLRLAQARQWWRFSAEAPAVAQARRQWRVYQRDTAPGNSDPIRVKQLALKMWRTRAYDSRRVAEIKDVLSVLAAIAFGIALIVSASLVWHARFTS
jgi:hypothetical protein